MKPEHERLLHLKRIADALEAMLPLLEKLANPPIMLPAVPPPAPTPAPLPNTGWRCAACGQWVYGNAHVCTGKTWPGTAPPWTSPNICRTGSDQSSGVSLPNVTVWNAPSNTASADLGGAASDITYVMRYGGVS
jgi:hypothetical protein